VLKTIEAYLPRLVQVPTGSTSHDCLLRAICEVAKSPENQDGLLGDFVNLLLTPTHILETLPIVIGDSDYLEAQRAGHYKQDCSTFEVKCPMSLFEVRKNIILYISM
jgi:hypothetical protein